MENALGGGQLVIRLGRLGARSCRAAQQRNSLLKFPLRHFYAGQLIERVIIVRGGPEGFGQEFLRARLVSLLARDGPEIVQTSRIARVFPQPFVEVFLRFLESPQVPVTQPHEGVGAGRGVQLDQSFKLAHRGRDLPDGEIAFSEGRVEVGALRRKLHSLLEHLYGVLEVRLHHAEAAHEENDVGVLRGQTARAQQEFARVQGLPLVGINLSQQVQGVRRVRLQGKGAFKYSLGLVQALRAQVRLPEVVQDLERARLKSVRQLELVYGERVLLLGCQHNPE